ncbi:hypothetical protein IMZ48_10165 [Candidatus Bathyarchaeota archaeon]|nr:hypothetical protein [Candidatus Bathyarchaeota archaeon]
MFIPAARPSHCVSDTGIGDPENIEALKMAAAPPLRAPTDGSHHNQDPTQTPLFGPRSAAQPAPTPTRPAHQDATAAHHSAMNNSSLSHRRDPSGSRFTEDWDASRRGSSIVDGARPRSSSRISTAAEDAALSRGNTLRKKASLRRSGSLRRTASGRSMRAGSVRSLALQAEPDEARSAFYCPVPTKGNPTDALAARFQGTCLHN